MVALSVAGTGSAGTGSAGTGSAGTGSAGTGSAGTGSAGTGSAGTGSAGTGSAGTGSAGTGSAGTGSAGTGSAGTGSAGTGSAGTGSAGTGSAGTGSAGTGSAGTGSAGTGSTTSDSPSYGGSIDSSGSSGGSSDGGCPGGCLLISPIDWNIDPLSKPDSGDPLIFSFGDKPAKTTRNWSEWHESRLTQFDLYQTGEKVTLSRTLDDGTMTLFLDLNGDGILTDGTEWLFDQHETVYQILSREMIDSNQNGYFDWTDELWHIAMVKDGSKYYSIDELDILAINWSDARHFDDDHYGRGVYSDCLYEGEFLYPFCTPVSTEHFRVTSYNEHGIIMQGGEIISTYGAVMGHLDMSE